MPDLPAQHPPGPHPDPGNGFLGWLGRQVGHISNALKTNVTGPKIIYRNDTVEELPHPENPNITMRRTVIDEVIVEKTPGQDS